MNFIAFVTLTFFVAHNKSLAWNTSPSDMAAQHIDYWTVEMQGGPNTWFRMGTTRTPQFMLPTGPYVRTFRVTANINPVWPFANPVTAPITTHL